VCVCVSLDPFLAKINVIEEDVKKRVILQTTKKTDFNLRDE